jgi:predicted nucleic acid-binding protein
VIGYIDTSAFVSIIVDEPASIAARQFWDEADAVVSSGLIVVETAAALASAYRSGRLTADGHRRAQRIADRLQIEFDLVAPDEGLVGRAAELARTHALRGYDAVHCASAESIDDQDLVAAAGDRQLLAAWAALGVVTFDPYERG